MTWTRFKLWAPDEASAIAAAAAVLDHDPTFTLRDEAGTAWLTISERHALDPIGTRWEGGEYDPETGEVVEPPKKLDGWFANLQVPPGIAEPVAALLLAVGGPHGVTLVEDTGRDWA